MKVITDCCRLDAQYLCGLLNSQGVLAQDFLEGLDLAYGLGDGEKRRHIRDTLFCTALQKCLFLSGRRDLDPGPLGPERNQNLGIRKFPAGSPSTNRMDVHQSHTEGYR